MYESLTPSCQVRETQPPIHPSNRLSSIARLYLPHCPIHNTRFLRACRPYSVRMRIPLRSLPPTHRILPISHPSFRPYMRRLLGIYRGHPVPPRYHPLCLLESVPVSSFRRRLSRSFPPCSIHSLV